MHKDARERGTQAGAALGAALLQQLRETQPLHPSRELVLPAAAHLHSRHSEQTAAALKDTNQKARCAETDLQSRRQVAPTVLQALLLQKRAAHPCAGSASWGGPVVRLDAVAPSTSATKGAVIPQVD